MAWNEPGGNNKDPWGGKKGNNDGPPDIDEIIKNAQEKISALFGGKSGGKGGGNNGSSGSSKGPSGFLIGLIAVAFVILYIVKGAGIVNEQERAVVLRLGKFKETIGPGFRWNPPLIDKVYTLNVTKVEEYPLSQQMLTKDLNIVDVDISAQYVVGDARDFVLNVRDPVESLKQSANSALRHVAGSTPMHDLLTEGREQAAAEIKERLQSYLDSYKTGIVIETVNIEESKPPREVQDAFDDVIKAREDEERFKNEAQTYANGIIPESRGIAQRMLEEAAGHKEKVVAQAEGEAKRFEYLLTEYKKAPRVTRERLYIDAVQQVMESSSKVMVDVEGGNNMMYLPLDKLVGAAQAPTPAPRMTSSDVSGLADQVLQDLINRGAITTSRRSRGDR